MQRDQLFVLAAPFEDGPGQMWFCAHCAMIEGALLANPHWAEHLDIHRIAFPRPRQELVELLGEDHQWLPALVLAEDGESAEASRAETGRLVLTDPVAITAHLARVLGGAAPHP